MTTFLICLGTYALLSAIVTVLIIRIGTAMQKGRDQ